MTFCTQTQQNIKQKSFRGSGGYGEWGPVSCCTVLSKDVTEAEESAIALTMTQSETKTIVSGSKSATRNFDRGRISNITWRTIANAKAQIKQATLVQAPAHQGLIGDEKAHATAQGLTVRAITATTETDSVPPYAEPLSSADDGLGNFQEIFRKFPGA